MQIKAANQLRPLINLRLLVSQILAFHCALIQVKLRIFPLAITNTVHIIHDMNSGMDQTERSIFILVLINMTRLRNSLVGPLGTWHLRRPENGYGSTSPLGASQFRSRQHQFLVRIII